MPFAEITKAQFSRWFHNYGADFPEGANSCRGIFSNMCSSAIQHGDVPSDYVNFCKEIEPYRRSSRPRFRLSAEQLASLGQAMTQFADLHNGIDIIALLIFTGCERDEIMTLKWSQWNDETLTFHGQDNTVTRVVHLGPLALTILRRRREFAVSQFVFPSRFDSEKSQAVLDFQWAKLRSAAGLPEGCRVRDLRSAFEHHAIMSGESLFMTRRLLGHQGVNMRAPRTIVSDADLMEAAERTGDMIEALLG